MDIILCNSNLGDSSRKMFSIQVPLKQRPAKWLSGGQISEENTQKGFKELYDFLDANQIEGINVDNIEQNNDKIGGKYKRSYKKYKRSYKKYKRSYKKYKRTKKQSHKKYKKSRTM
jgi:hypothetical protein